MFRLHTGAAAEFFHNTLEDVCETQRLNLISLALLVTVAEITNQFQASTDAWDAMLQDSAFCAINAGLAIFFRR